MFPVFNFQFFAFLFIFNKQSNFNFLTVQCILLFLDSTFYKNYVSTIFFSFIIIFLSYTKLQLNLKCLNVIPYVIPYVKIKRDWLFIARYQVILYVSQTQGNRNVKIGLISCLEVVWHKILLFTIMGNL